MRITSDKVLGVAREFVYPLFPTVISMFGLKMYSHCHILNLTKREARLLS